MGVMMHKAMKMTMNGHVQAVAQQEVPAVEGVACSFPLSGPWISPQGELGHPQQVDQVILVIESGVPAVLDRLEILGQLHLGVKQPVFVDVLFVLDLMVRR